MSTLLDQSYHAYFTHLFAALGLANWNYLQPLSYGNVFTNCLAFFVVANSLDSSEIAKNRCTLNDNLQCLTERGARRRWLAGIGASTTINVQSKAQRCAPSTLPLIDVQTEAHCFARANASRSLAYGPSGAFAFVAGEVQSVQLIATARQTQPKCLWAGDLTRADPVTAGSQIACTAAADSSSRLGASSPQPADSPRCVTAS